MARAKTTGEGANNLALCQSIHGLETEEGRRFGAGILKVINGDLDFYTQEYACHSPTEQRWFVGRVTRFPGRGMGLSLVQGILRAHEGCVTVTSTPGEGTSINVY